jgi:ABC-type multidrug transport system, ATPase and permease components
MAFKFKNKLLSNNIYIIKLLIKLCPGRVFASLIQSFINYFSWIFFSIIFMQYIFNSFKERDFYGSLILIAIFMIIFFLLLLYSSWYEKKYKPITDQEINYQINKIIFDKASNVDISCYENPNFYNNYSSAISQANVRAVEILNNVTDIISVSLSSIFVLFTMINIDIISVFFIIIPVISSFVFNRLANKLRYKTYLENIPNNRKKDYVSRTIFLKKYAKEIRLSNIYDILEQIYTEGYEANCQNINKYGKRIFCYSFLRAFLSFPMAFETVWLYASYRAIVTKSFTMSDYIILANAIVNITNMLLRLVNSLITATENGLYIDTLKGFLNYKEKISEEQKGLPINGKVHTIEFRNVGFTYDGQDKPVLKKINMVIHSNEVIALVGLNGSGKSTLIKLMMRLYDVSEGEILLNGINIKKYNLKEYRNLFSTIFQDFQIMAMKVIENVFMNDITDDKQRSFCENLLRKSGIYDKVNSLPKGVDTILTKEFDDEGAVLSGGEIQKIAIARAYAKNSPIIILDEPSSALDPIAEYEMYNSLKKIFGDNNKAKMAILISHRVSSAVLANKVYLIENGEVIEEGTHDQLISKNGKYANIYMKQAQSYINKNSLGIYCYE